MAETSLKEDPEVYESSWKAGSSHQGIYEGNASVRLCWAVLE